MAQKVIRVNNATARRLITEFTQQNTFPDVIEFVKDGNGAYVTSVENIQNVRYVGIRQDFRQFLIANGINTTITSLKEALQTYGAVIDYVPPVSVLE